ncbi:TPA: DEAD/DEAH box helicase, partial [Candidatus Poribacteria bacterium]|nr:DEAD/DEAH box helicase [Candidatus Poribacteria bacterium]
METTMLSSGYVCSTVYSSFKSDPEKKLLGSLCNFGIREISSKEFTQPDEEQQQILAILSNQICRGFPTFCSLYVEQELIRVFGQYLETQEEKNETEFRFSISDCHKELLLKALCVIEPRWRNLARPMQDFSGSEQAQWLYHQFPDYMRQLVLPEREFQNGLVAGDERNFFRQRVDFALETYSGCRWILEVDGKQHQELSQAEKDNLRDDDLRNADWQLKRIKTSEIQNHPAVLSEFWQSLSQDEFLGITKENYTRPLWESDVGLAALHVALTPFAIARLQNVIVRLLQEGAISLRQSAWNVAVFEQDVACTALAFDDLFQLLRNLYVLLGKKESFPKVNLSVLNTEEFNRPVEWQIRSKNVHVSTIGEIGGKADPKYDIVLDISMLRRFGFEQLNEVQRSLCPEGTCVLIRSGYSLTPKRTVATAPPITYAISTGEQEASLTYFLQNLFRKKRFREGQISIIRRALSRKNTIGLLPTGAGKSLCYQLVTLLQPCMTLVIEPLRSLMIDQDTNLKKIGIDCSAFISSDLDAKEKDYVVKRMRRGEFQIVFVSPERLQIKKFRLDIEVLASEKPIGYAVIDEAHCVSEWGHDFRTSYLTLARTIRKFCKFRGMPPPFYALTGTASISVLTDVCAELEIDEKEREGAIITPITFDRPELNFRICNKVPSAQKFETLQKLFEEIQARFDIDENTLLTPNGENTYSGLLFCPHVRKTDFAVTKLKSKIG